MPYPPAHPEPGSLAAYAGSFRLQLRSRNCSPSTVSNYLGSIEMLERNLVSRGRSTQVAEVTKADLQEFMASILDESNKRPGKVGTAAARFRALRVFFNWIVDEEDLTRSPMKGMVIPKGEVKRVKVICDDTLVKLFKACEGTKFNDRRDLAIFRILYGCGFRRDELLSMDVEGTDVTEGLLVVKGKGRLERAVPVNAKAAAALDRYLRERHKHRYASLPNLWLTSRGAMQETGLRVVLETRTKKAGVPHIHPHQFRHTFAHKAKVAGVNDDDLMVLAGWKDRDMLAQYAASTAEVRAVQTSRRLSIGDDL